MLVQFIYKSDRRKLSLRLRISTNVRRYFQPPTLLHRVRAAGLPAILADLPHGDASPRLGVDLDAHAATVLDAGRRTPWPWPLGRSWPTRVTSTSCATRRSVRTRRRGWRAGCSAISRAQMSGPYHYSSSSLTSRALLCAVWSVTPHLSNDPAGAAAFACRIRCLVPARLRSSIERRDPPATLEPPRTQRFRVPQDQPLAAKVVHVAVESQLLVYM